MKTREKSDKSLLISTISLALILYYSLQTISVTLNKAIGWYNLWEYIGIGLIIFLLISIIKMILATIAENINRKNMIALVFNSFAIYLVVKRILIYYNLLNHN